MIMPFAGSTAPSGWLFCTGGELSRADEAGLFSAIGTTYGAGDGSTTFNLPDMRDRMPVGAGATYPLGATGGEATHRLSVAEMPSHTHTQNSHNHTQNSHNHAQNSHTHGDTFAVGSAGAHAHTFDVNNEGNSGGPPLVGSNRAAGSRSTDSAGAHTHPLNGAVVAATASNVAATATNVAATAVNQSTGGGDAHNNMPPYIAMNYIIKT
jgi:microcystin-dependent protein